MYEIGVYPLTERGHDETKLNWKYQILPRWLPIYTIKAAEYTFKTSKVIMFVLQSPLHLIKVFKATYPYMHKGAQTRASYKLS